MVEHIDYTIRVSRRARRARIVVRPNLSVEVVLPHGMPNYHAANFVREKKVWIERSLRRFGEHAEPGKESRDDPFPRQLSLDAMDLNLPVIYLKTESGRLHVAETEEGLRLKGCVDDAERVSAALQRWLKKKAKENLPPMLEGLSKACGYRYRKVTIRLQKCRWGSCSRVGDISLNAKLLFLPPHLVRYVMLHELAHLKHLNHSSQFWAEVACSDPNYRSHVSEMRSVHRLIPGWVESQG
ncbi:MAG TPA: SprT family zinc-dependent metalloprotease [Mariprofundaceae bacterium]|nr:SprT family zinc-dependent metalloprotease [Mariprofundaceae bacterium]